MDDIQAIARLKAGDIQGLEFLVRGYQVEAIRTAYLILRDRSAAEDVVQAAFVKIYEQIDQFDETRPFRPYFLRVVANAAIKRVRQESRTVSLEANSEEQVQWLDDIPSSVPSPELLAEQVETSEQLALLLAQLPSEQSAVLVLSYYAELTGEEIAERLDVPAGTVRWRLHAARKYLRNTWKRIEDRFDKSAQRMMTRSLPNESEKVAPTDG